MPRYVPGSGRNSCVNLGTSSASQLGNHLRCSSLSLSAKPPHPTFSPAACCLEILKSSLCMRVISSTSSSSSSSSSCMLEAAGDKASSAARSGGLIEVGLAWNCEPEAWPAPSLGSASPLLAFPGRARPPDRCCCGCWCCATRLDLRSCTGELDSCSPKRSLSSSPSPNSPPSSSSLWNPFKPLESAASSSISAPFSCAVRSASASSPSVAPTSGCAVASSSSGKSSSLMSS